VVNLTSPSNTDSDIYISKLDANGKLIWAKQIGGTGSDEGNEIVLDGKGNLYITGNFTGSNFRYNPNNPSQTYSSVDGRKDIFVTKLTTDGNLVWSKQIGGAENQDGLSLEVDSAGNVYYSGEFRGSVDFDPGSGATTLSSPNAISSFISKLSANGDFQWAVPLNGNSATLSLSDIAVNSTGNVIAGTGYFSSADADLDPGAGLFNPSFTQARDAFVTKLQVPNAVPLPSGFNPGAVVALTPGFDPEAAELSGLFSLTNLGTLGGRFSQAFDINNSGKIVGWANDTAGNRRPALWQIANNGQQGNWVDLGTPNAVSGQAQGINNRGQIVGFVDNQAQRSAILWNGTSSTNLGNLGASFAAGYAINDFGAATGVSRDASGTDFNPFLWTANAGMSNLRRSPSNFDFAWDINNRSQVAGYSTIGNDNKPTVWQGNQATILADLGGGFGNAQGINDFGFVVGFTGNSTTNPSARVATLWSLSEPNKPINLGSLAGGSRSTALRINNLNQVVGWSRDAADQTQATLWQNNRIFNLNNLVVNRQGWNLTFAWGINDNGSIVGYGDFQGNNPRAFLLAPLDTSGNDNVYGNAGDEALYGGAGNDNLYAGEGNNYLSGGDGDDNLHAGSGNDRIYAGSGNDRIYAGEGNNFINGGAGNDEIYAGAGNDLIDAGDGNNKTYAGEGKNTINSGAGDDLIFGGSSQDIINSGAGNDLIYAGEGNNIVNSGTGNDQVYLGSGVDTLILNSGVGSVTVFAGFGQSDKISLGSGLTAQNISLTVDNGDTLIKAGNDLLATLKWVQLSSLNFV
jgi:probable HAF family extracellular repeat protein